ncbi:hypothetical protein, partial [Vallitalea longa]|uniref:hypothetical protein n=1 Tax=Vallitalea longa TaxID=2936439 RepID=UPI00248FE9CF
TDEASNILNGLPNGMKWGPNTQKNLKYYYNQKAPYDKLYSIITVDLKLGVTSSIDDHTIDMSKGEGSAQVKLSAEAEVIGFKTNDPQMKPYLENPSNIRQMVFTISDGTTTKEKTITSFSKLIGKTNFTFDYLPNDVEDGDSDLDDSIIKSYSCTVEVEYYRQCHGTATKTNEA